jgi:septal ring factor EnvC (AmiA/AmiB activator)
MKQGTSKNLHTCLRLFLFAIFCIFLSGNIRAQNTQTLEAQRKALLEEIDATSSLLSEIRTSASASLNRLNLLSSQVESRKKIITVLNQELVGIDKDIAAMNQELNELEKDLKSKRDKYATTVQSMYTHHLSQYKWLFILSTNNFSQIVLRIRYVREYASWQKQQGTLILKKQDEISKKKSEIEKSRTEKVTLLSAREEENKKLQKEEADQRAEQQQLSRKQSALQAELTRQRNQAAALSREIERLIANDNSRSNSASNSRTTTTTAGSYRMTSEEQKLAADFASNKGRLPFPLSGRYRIVKPFGEYQHPQNRNVRLKNNGIDIQTTAGTEARAIFDGIVTRVFTLQGSANYNVIVRHGNYLSFYSNLSEVFVKNGEKVSTSQRLGKIFTDTKNDNSTILHFELLNERERLNPQSWIK